MFRLRCKKSRVLLALPDVVDVAFPFEVFTDSTSQIFSLINRFEDMIMKAIVEFHWCFITSDGEHVTFMSVESHLP